MATLNYKEKLKKLVDDSNIIPQQKKLWNIFVTHTEELEAEAIYEAASSSQENLQLLSNNLHDKILAMLSGSKDAWNKVIEEEKRYLELYE